MKNRRIFKRIQSIILTSALIVGMMSGFATEVAALTAYNVGGTVTYTKGGSPVVIDSNMYFDSTVTGTYFEIQPVQGFKSGDVLGIQSASNTNTNGAISLGTGSDSNTIFIGNGSGREQVATIDDYYNGENGKSLRINFATPFTNGTFDSSLSPGWSVDYSYNQLASDDGNPGMTTTASVVDGQAKLTISGGVTPDGGKSHGPSLTSDSFYAYANDTVSLYYKAIKTSDWADVYGYLINVNTGAEHLLFYESTASFDGTVEGTVPSDGDWKFKFICGTWDETNGGAVGSEMYIDNVVLESGRLDKDVANAILDNIVFSTTTSSYSSTLRSWRIDYGSDEMYSSSTANIDVKLQAPTITSTSATTDSVTFNYSAVSGASEYYYTTTYMGNSSAYTTSNTSATVTVGPNVGVSFSVRAEGQGQDNDSAYTSANICSYAKVPTISVTNQSPDYTKNDLDIDANGNPLGTEYEIEYRVNSGSWTSVDGWFTDTAKTHSGLSAGSTYEYRVRARNYDAVITDWSETESISLNQQPSLSSLNPITNVYKSEITGFTVFELSGIATDADNDTVTVSATVNGEPKTTTASSTGDGSGWSLSWDMVDDSFPETSITSVVVGVDDGNGKSNSSNTLTWSKTLYVDKTGPLVPTINTNTNWTNDASVPVTITNGVETGSYQSGISGSEYRLTGATTLGWTTFSGEFNITNEGETTIEARSFDNVGNKGVIETAVVKIDRDLPEGGSFNIDATYEDTVYTRTRTVDLENISASDTGGAGDGSNPLIPAQMEISNVPDFTVSSGWVPYNATYPNWTLTENDGTKTVYVRFKDSVGNVGLAMTDTIVFDSTAPILSISTPSTYAARKGATVDYTITIDDSNATTYGINSNDKVKVILSGVGTIEDKISEIQDAITIEDTSSTAKTVSIHLPADMVEEGIVSIKVLASAAIDPAGNESVETLGNFSLIVDSTPPTNQDVLFDNNLDITGGQPVDLVKASISCEGGEEGDSVRFAPIGYDGTEAANGVTITSTHGKSEVINAPTQAGDYRLYVIDAAGNISLASESVLTVKNLGPTVTIEGPSRTHVQASNSVEYIVTYSEDTSEITLGQYDVGVIRTGTANAYVSVEDIEGETNKKKIILTNLMGEGTVAIKIGAESAVDAIGNKASASAVSSTVSVDNTPALISNVAVVSNNGKDNKLAIEGNTVTLTFTTNESVLDYPTVLIGERAANVSALNDENTSWKAELSIAEGTNMDNGELSVSISGTSDIAGNISSDVTAVDDGTLVSLDTIAPELVITGDKDDTDQYYITPPILTFADGTLTLKNLTNNTESNPNTGVEVNIAGRYEAILEDAAGNIDSTEFVFSKDYVDAMSDKETLKIVYEVGDSQTYVTRNIGLATEGVEGSAISWQVNAGTSVAVDGAVTRPVGANEEVTLQATITKGATTVTKTFTLTVIKEADPDFVGQANDDKSVLVIDYAEGDDETNVTLNIGLSDTGAINGSSVAWESSDETVITVSETAIDGAFTGNVTRPAFGDGDADITLTATIDKEGSSVTKEFNLHVVEAEGSDIQMLAIDKTKVDVIYGGIDTADSVTENITLVYTGTEETLVVWTSNHAAVSINGTNGVVIRPEIADGDVIATVTATLTRGDVSEVVEFPVTVKAKEDNEENNRTLMEADLANVEVGYRFTDNQTAVTTHVILPTVGENGSTISWSSNGIVVSNDGTVSRDIADTEVTLTATVTSGTVSGTKSFTLNVKAKELDLLHQLGADADLAGVIFAEGDSSDHVTSDLVLVSNGSNGCTWSWSSSDESVILTDGTVIRPIEATEVTLRVAVSQEGYIIYKEFIVNVIKIDE